MTNETNGETFALETRVEELTYLSGDRRVRRGESDRLEVGSGPAQDIVSGTEHTRIGGTLSEHTGGNLSAQASRMETTVEGKLTQHFKSNTTLLGGAMTEVYTGGVFIGAGMSDDLVIGGGVRVTAPADLWLCGLIGMEEKIGSACADGALLELYRLAFEREYATGVHAAGAAVFSGTVHATMATGFRQLFKVSRGVRDLTPGGNAEGGDAPAPPAAPAPAPAPGGEAASGGMLMAQGATEMEDAEDLAALEDIRHLFGDLDTTVDSGRTGDRAALLEDLGSLAKYSETGEDVGDAGALANRLQEGAGLSDVVDAEDLRAILRLDESPETLGETRLIPDEMIGGQWLDQNGDWVENVGDDAALTTEDFENVGSLENTFESVDMRQHRLDLGLPEDFDYKTANKEFFDNYVTRFRADMVPGTSEMQRARAHVDDLIRTQFENLPQAWIDDLDLSPSQLEAALTDSGPAYQRMAEMQEAARNAGDIAKADFLQGTLDNIDAQVYYTYQSAIERAEALRARAVNSTLPETVHQEALYDALRQKMDDAQAEFMRLMETDYLNDPALMAQMDLVAEQMNTYKVLMDTVAQGKDPVLYLDEMVRLSADAAGTNTHRVEGMLELQSELMQMFSDPEFGFTWGDGIQPGLLGSSDNVGGDEPVYSRLWDTDTDTIDPDDPTYSHLPRTDNVEIDESVYSRLWNTDTDTINPDDPTYSHLSYTDNVEINEPTNSHLSDADHNLGNSDDVGINAHFTDPDEAAYYDTGNAALRGQLDISSAQLSLEDADDPVYSYARISDRPSGPGPNDPGNSFVPGSGPTNQPAPPELPPKKLPDDFNRREALTDLDNIIENLMDQIEVAELNGANSDELRILQDDVDIYMLARAAIARGEDPCIALHNAFMNGSTSLDMQHRVQDAIEFLDTTFDFNSGGGT